MTTLVPMKCLTELVSVSSLDFIGNNLLSAGRIFHNVKVLRSGSVYALNLIQDEYARDFTLRNGDQVVIQDLQANRSHSFYPVGNFSKPGRYSLDRSGYTLMDLLGEAKGALSEPKFTRRIYVFRRIGEERKVIEVDVRQLTKMESYSRILPVCIL